MHMPVCIMKRLFRTIRLQPSGFFFSCLFFFLLYLEKQLQAARFSWCAIQLNILFSHSAGCPFLHHLRCPPSVAERVNKTTFESLPVCCPAPPACTSHRQVLAKLRARGGHTRCHMCGILLCRQKKCTAQVIAEDKWTREMSDLYCHIHTTGIECSHGSRR